MISIALPFMGVARYAIGDLVGAVAMVSRDRYAYVVNELGIIVKFDMNISSYINSKNLDYSPGITSGAVLHSNAYFGTTNATMYRVHIPNDCPYALGGPMLHNTNKTVYTTELVCGTSCDPYSGYINCYDGEISGDSLFPYIYTNCRTVSACCNTTFGMLELGDTIEVYEKSIAGCGDTCVPGNITCEMGGLQGNTTWEYSNCTEVIDNCPCTQYSMVHNQTKYFYLNSSGNCLDGCIGGELLCLNGTIHGNTSYTKSSCKGALMCPCINVVGGILGEGESRVLYSSSKSPCTSTCAANSVTVTCKNGKPLFNSLGNYTYLNCTECGVEPISLQKAINATLELTTSTIRMFFPATSNVSVTFSKATDSNRI